MTNPMMNSQPNYSGVTIQISNPSVYAGSNGSGMNAGNCMSANQSYCNGYGGMDAATNPIKQNNPYAQLDPAYNAVPAPQVQAPAYPPQYYLNNYNYSNNGTAKGVLPEKAEQIPTVMELSEVRTPDGAQLAEETRDANDFAEKQKSYNIEAEEEQDFTKSNGIINDLDARAAAEEEAKKNSKQKRVVALTDEYIKSLENYLNNPNDEIRLMASKEILTRLDEDKDRYDDAALNALLNKMLQDPSKLIRVAALSAFASQLASGNDYTVQLLQNIQQNPSADKEDVIQAADILLKMSAGTEIKNIPNPAVKAEAQEGNK